MLEQTIRVILTGICTFVGADVGDNNRPLTAVFANATHHKPEHHVSLIISEEDYEVETDGVSSSLIYSEMGKPFRVILLDGKGIALAGVVEQALSLAESPLSKAARDQHRPTTLTELESVQWIPSLGRAWPRPWPLRRARRMLKGFYSAKADPRLVGASFELPNGRLSSHWVSGDIWRFEPRTWARFRYETAIAQEVLFETKVGSVGVRFDLCDLETRRHCGYVRISHRNPGPRPAPIEVVIANVPDEDRLPGSIVFCGDCGVSECQLSDDPSPCTCVDPHYAHYYDGMSSGRPDRPSLPRRIDVGIPLKPVAMRVGGGNCAPTTYP